MFELKVQKAEAPGNLTNLEQFDGDDILSESSSLDKDKAHQSHTQ